MGDYDPKAGQSVEERAQISADLVERLSHLLKDLPVEVIGHAEATGLCCRNGTVAMVEIDAVSLPGPE